MQDWNYARRAQRNRAVKLATAHQVIETEEQVVIETVSRVRFAIIPDWVAALPEESRRVSQDWLSPGNP